MSCYRVWYSNGGAVLVDAETVADAGSRALKLAEQEGYRGLSITEVENLDGKE